VLRGHSVASSGAVGQGVRSAAGANLADKLSCTFSIRPRMSG
jgi:hypothetical protein